MERAGLRSLNPETAARSAAPSADCIAYKSSEGCPLVNAIGWHPFYLRLLLARDFPEAAALLIYNTQPTNRARQFDLAKAPHDWLYAQVPSSYVLSRPDLRLGMDRRSQQVRVLAGYKRRAGKVGPIWLRCVGRAPHEWAGFEPCSPVGGEGGEGKGKEKGL